MTADKPDEGTSEKTERNEAIQKGVPKEAEVAKHSSVESINEPPGSDVHAGIPPPGETAGPGLAAAQQSQQQEEQRQAQQAPQPAKPPPQQPPQPVKEPDDEPGDTDDPDELEDEIDQAREEGDIEPHKSRGGPPPKKGKR